MISSEIIWPVRNKRVWWWIVVLIGLAGLILKPKLSLGVSSGVLLELLNLKILTWTTMRGLNMGQRARGYILLSFWLRIPVLALIFGIGFLWLRWLFFIGLLTGFTGALIIAGILSLFRTMEVQNGG